MVHLFEPDAVLAVHELPMVGAERLRGDAAANRERILSAARKLLADYGANALTMQAVADAAGVGKGTVFRRFGGRDGLIAALLDEYMRDLQNAFLHGPPPLGPGASAERRLQAFIAELINWQATNLALALAAETGPGRASASVYATLHVHIASLVNEINKSLDARIVASLILNAIAPGVLNQIRNQYDVDTAALQSAARALLNGVTKAPD